MLQSNCRHYNNPLDSFFVFVGHTEAGNAHNEYDKVVQIIDDFVEVMDDIGMNPSKGF